MSIITTNNQNTTDPFTASLNTVDSLSQMSVKELKRLKTGDFHSIIQKSGTGHHSFLDPVECHKTLGQKMHHLKVKIGVQVIKNIFYTCVGDKNREVLIAELVDNIQPKYLKQMLQYDGKESFHAMKHNAGEALRQYQDKGRMEKSLKHEVSLFALSRKEMKRLDLSRRVVSQLQEIAEEQKPQGVDEKIEGKCSDDTVKWSQRYLRNRETVAKELLKLRVFCKQRNGFLSWLNDANERVKECKDDEDITRSVKFLFRFHDRHVYTRNRYLSTNLRIASVSPYRDEDILMLKELLEDTNSSPEEKKRVILQLHAKIWDRLEDEIKKDEATIQILDKAYSGKKNGDTYQVIKGYIDRYEADIVDPFLKAARQYQDLQKVISSKERFTNHMNNLGTDENKLLSYMKVLQLRLKDVTAVEAEVRRLLPQSSKDVHWWSEYYIDSYRLEQKVSNFAFDLLFWSRGTDQRLPIETIKAIDIAQLNPALNLLGNIRHNELTSQLKTLTLTCRKDSRLGLHQLVSWQIQQVKDRLHTLGVDTEPVQDDDISEELRVVEKLASLGFDADTFSLEPFNFPKLVNSQGFVDWKAYGEILLEKGVFYEDIEQIDDYNAFVDYYINDRPFVQLARKVASMGLAPKDRKISLQEYICNGKKFVEREINYEAIKHIRTKEEFYLWVASKELDILPPEMLVMIFSYLNPTDVGQVRLVNKRFWGVIADSNIS